MSNQIEYGLKFTEDLDKALAKAKEIDKQVADTISKKQKGNKIEFLEVEAEVKMREHLAQMEIKLAKENFLAEKIMQEKLASLEISDDKRAAELKNKLLNEEYLAERKMIEDLAKFDIKQQEKITKERILEEKKRNKQIEIDRKLQAKGNIREAIVAPVSRTAKYLATATVFYQGIGALKSGRDVVINLDRELGNLRAALDNATESDISFFKQYAHSQHLIEQYGISAKTAAEGMTILAKAGLNAQEVIAALEPSLALAAAGQIDLAEASETLIKVTTGAGLDIRESGRIADYIAQIDVASITNIRELGDALKIAAPAGKAFGQSIESTISVLGAMSKAGLKGASAGNAYSRVMLRMTKNQKEVADGLKKYGIDIFDKATGKIRDFGEIFKDIDKSGVLKNVADGQQIFGTYAYKSATQIATAATEIDKMKKALEGSEGAAKRMSEIKMDTLAGELQKLKANWDNAFTGKDGIGNTLKDATFALNQWIVLLNKALNIGEGGSLLSWYTNIFKEANKEIEKTQKMLGQLQDATLDAGVGNETKRKRRIDFLIGISDKDLQNKIKLYERNIATFSKSVSEKQLLIANRSSAFWPSDVKKARLAGETIEGDKAVLAEQRQYLAIAEAIYKQRKKNAEIKVKEDKPLLTTTGTAGKKPKERYDDLDSFYKKLFALSNDYRQKEFDNVDKNSAELNAKYEELYLELYNMKLKDIDRKKALDYLEQVNTLGNTEMITDLIILGRKKAEEEELKVIKEFSDAKQKVIDEEYEKRIKSIEDAYEKEKEVREKYQGLAGKLSDLKDQQKLELEAAGNNEELKFNIRKAYAEQAVQLAYETWQKEHEYANTAMSAIGSAYDTLAQSMTDMDMSGKERRETVWESFRSTAITALMDVLKQQLINFALSKVFSASVTAATAAEAGILATAWTPAAYLASVATLGAAAGIGTAALAGGLASSAALTTGIGLFNNTGGLGGGFPVQDAVVSDGKVYPYRKDDLVMIGTNMMDSRSGASIPAQASLPANSGYAGSNSAVISELRSLRIAVASGNAQISKAVADNRPIVQGKFLDNVDVYKAATIGGKQANFVVNNNK